jgi:hypothetical protein
MPIFLGACWKAVHDTAMRFLAPVPLFSEPAMKYGLACSMFVLTAAMGAPAHATSFDCTKRCGVEYEDAYPHLIVGTVDGLATAEQSAALFQAMRKAKRWAALAPDPEAFRKSVQPVSIRLPSGRSYTVLIMQEEARAAPIKIGDFVRYSPHRGAYEKPPSEAADIVAYWKTTGCVAVLCRAGDGDCSRGYRNGIYRATDGAALTLDGRHAEPNAPGIDPGSMRPR